MAELQIAGVSKAFGTTPVLRGLTLSVRAGSLVAVLGASGSGKTTLLRLICGFDRADAGTIAIGGALVCGPGLHLRPEQRHIGYVAQEGALFPHLSVADNITFGLPWRQRRARHRVAELLAMSGLPEAYADRAPHQVRDQHGLDTALGVVAHQQESSIAGQVLQPVDIGAGEVDERSDPIGDGLCDASTAATISRWTPQ